MAISKRQAAIRRRRKFIFFSSVAVVLIITVGILGINALINAFSKPENPEKNNSITSGSENKNPSSSAVQNSESSVPANKDNYNPDNKQMVTVNGTELDANFRRVALINGKNPLPDNYDKNVRAYLVTIDANLRNNNYVTDIHKDVYPYITAMVKAAQAEGINLKVWSPFRSYGDQKVLFERQVQRQNGDEEKAATVVARPGTSEHNTGLCADFNMADDKFESTPMYTWMVENAEDYGFILRYPKDKTDITGVIYESWHWRFVGINTAKEMNKLKMTLEEYVEYKNIDWQSELN